MARQATNRSLQDKAGPAPTRAVERALALLVEVASNDGLGLVELSRRADLSLATARRLLLTLEAAEFVRRDDDGAYHGAARLIQVAVTSMNSDLLYRAAEPHLAALRDAVGETAYLGVQGPHDTVLYARLAESDKSVRHQGWLGRTVSVEGTAVGAALCGRCGELGYISAQHVIEGGITAVAATVTWPGGGIAGAMSVVGPSSRVSEARIPDIGTLVATHAQNLSRDLGASDGPGPGAPQANQK